MSTVNLAVKFISNYKILIGLSSLELTKDLRSEFTAQDVIRYQIPLRGNRGKELRREVQTTEL